MRKYVLFPVLAMGLVLLSRPATARSQKTWLDGHVASQGHITGDLGTQISTATIVLLDPENANPLARKEVLAINVKQLGFGKTKVDLTTGTPIKAYLKGTDGSGGIVAIRYVDDKQHEREELHMIVTALGSEDAP
jgi:hypothetical protein